ncbi:hypothetical protein JG687_00010521 [Phytophthora cactorum]|uniref:Uncharacterized protein n=1 Tax=Phytophthora cactorum TaxID=29920 RepID=A0A8T1UBQ9_9STRA|nr:hypothetical protein GQ600_174 [Phytophthora cactorum]KAG6956580.1 hypothetical protein JG687_00010521 [Phytophthora cactorum]
MDIHLLSLQAQIYLQGEVLTLVSKTQVNDATIGGVMGKLFDLRKDVCVVDAGTVGRDVSALEAESLTEL